MSSDTRWTRSANQMHLGTGRNSKKSKTLVPRLLRFESPKARTKGKQKPGLQAEEGVLGKPVRRVGLGVGVSSRESCQWDRVDPGPVAVAGLFWPHSLLQGMGPASDSLAAGFVCFTGIAGSTWVR